jgi:hypothetical protein
MHKPWRRTKTRALRRRRGHATRSSASRFEPPIAKPGRARRPVASGARETTRDRS